MRWGLSLPSCMLPSLPRSTLIYSVPWNGTIRCCPIFSRQPIEFPHPLDVECCRGPRAYPVKFSAFYIHGPLVTLTKFGTRRRLSSSTVIAPGTDQTIVSKSSCSQLSLNSVPCRFVRFRVLRATLRVSDSVRG